MSNRIGQRASTKSVEDAHVPKVYCWCNSGAGTDIQIWIAMAEDGNVITSHCCSDESRAFADLYERKLDLYRAKYGDCRVGIDFELVFDVAPKDVYERNQELARQYAEAEASRV